MSPERAKELDRLTAGVIRGLFIVIVVSAIALI